MSDVPLIKNKIFIAACLYALSNYLGVMLHLWGNPGHVRSGLGTLKCFMGVPLGQFLLLLGGAGAVAWVFCLIPLALLGLFFKLNK